MKPVSRWIVFICSILMVGAIFLPFWKISLSAPQYPEGLEMYIHANGLKGEVELINGLNHYIGMKTISNDDFPEFKILPYWLSFIVLLGLITFVLNNKKWLYAWVSVLILTGIVGMADFWKWEYEYGHHLDPHAAIIVPGMSYQPPLLGYKQLLNFIAGSFPAIGGYMIIVPGILVTGVAFLEWQKHKKNSYAKMG